MSIKISNVATAVRGYPYRGLGAILLFEYVLLKLTRYSFPAMSIIPLVKELYDLDSEEEFRVRYYASRINFDPLWTSKKRETVKDIESFYQEHDMDIWRQAYLSKYNYIYKKKILRSYHIVRPFPKGARILDYGCGAGAVAHYIASKGYIVDVADIPSKTLDFVRQKMSSIFGNITTVEGVTDFGSEQYDVISTLDVLEHTLSPLAITEKLIAALKHGGILHVAFPVETDFSDPHTREAQIERPQVFEYLKKNCEELVPELIYRKR